MNRRAPRRRPGDRRELTLTLTVERWATVGQMLVFGASALEQLPDISAGDVGELGRAHVARATLEIAELIGELIARDDARIEDERAAARRAQRARRTA